MSVCISPLLTIPGTGFNIVQVPGPGAGGSVTNSAYKSIAEELLYEIWQTLLLILAANAPAMTKIISFTIGDGQADTPLAGTSSIQLPALQGQSIVNVNLLVIRNGIELVYSSAVAVKIIRRYNHGGNGGFVFEPASGITFQNGEDYNIFIVGQNTTDQV